jgi:hypothetical protein
LFTPDEKKQDLKESDVKTHELKVEITIMSKIANENRTTKIE